MSTYLIKFLTFANFENNSLVISLRKGVFRAKGSKLGNHICEAAGSNSRLIPNGSLIFLFYIAREHAIIKCSIKKFILKHFFFNYYHF